MSKHNCPNCGAPLDGSGTCSYCGTVFEVKKNPFGEIVYVAVGDPQADVLRANTVIDYDHMRYIPEDLLAKQAVDRIAHSIAESLAEYLKLDVREDPVRRAKIISGTIRVIPPDFRF